MKNSGAKLQSIFVPGTKIINIGAGHYFIAFISAAELRGITAAIIKINIVNNN